MSRPGGPLRAARLASGLVALLLLLASGPAAAQRADLVVGYRADVPPFSSVAQPAPDGRLTVQARADPADPSGPVITGYMISLCATVLEEMRKREEFSVDYRAIGSAADRFALLERGEIDLLCDPATINQERLEIASVMVSPPVYLSGIGVAGHAGRLWTYHWPCSGPLVGIVEGTTAARAVQRIAKAGGFGPTFSEVIAAHPYGAEIVLSERDAKELANCAAQAASDGIDAQRLKPGRTAAEAIAVRDFETHEALAAALCSGEIYYSVGDLEIIAQALQAVRQRDQPDCQAEINPQVFSEERYGIFVHVSEGLKADPEIARRDRLVVAFLRQLSVEIHKGTQSLLVRSFADNFERRNISRSLDLFFWSIVAGGN